MPRGVLGREAESGVLEAFLDQPGPGLAFLTGPRGTGKTTLAAEGLRGREAVHFRALPLPAEELLRDFEQTLRAVLGEVPGPRTPGLLPLPGPEARWEALLTGIVDRAEGDRPLILALDGAEHLTGAHRRWGPSLAGAVALARERGAPLKVVVVGRRGEVLKEALGLTSGPPGPDTELELGPLPYRTAGWAHGARSAEEAFLLWAVFGDHAAHLPPEGSQDRGRDLGARVVARTLRPAGDLFDAPLRALEATFQRPARYLALLRTLSEGPLDWSRILERTPGVASGGQLAPYLRRLEEEGFVQVERPMGSDEGSRNRRYLLRDPFLAFWCGLVLPDRSLLSGLGPEAVWRERIRPRLGPHLDRWLARAARRWLRAHASEALPAPARTVGGLWDDEAEFDAVAWLENGQVCYGLSRWSDEPLAGDELHRDMTARMKATRYGIGREARAPLYFLSGGGDEVLRRQTARNPLSRILGLEDLMGTEPPPGS